MTINIITGKTSRVCQENNNLTLFLGLLVILAYIFIRTFFSFFVWKYYCCPELSKRTETVYILSVSLFHFFFDSHFFSPEHFSMNECNEIYWSVITLWSKKMHKISGMRDSLKSVFYSAKLYHCIHILTNIHIYIYTVLVLLLFNLSIVILCWMFWGSEVLRVLWDANHTVIIIGFVFLFL